MTSRNGKHAEEQQRKNQAPTHPVGWRKPAERRRHERSREHAPRPGAPTQTVARTHRQPQCGGVLALIKGSLLRRRAARDEDCARRRPWCCRLVKSAPLGLGRRQGARAAEHRCCPRRRARAPCHPLASSAEGRCLCFGPRGFGGSGTGRRRGLPAGARLEHLDVVDVAVMLELEAPSNDWFAGTVSVTRATRGLCGKPSLAARGMFEARGSENPDRRRQMLLSDALPRLSNRLNSFRR